MARLFISVCVCVFICCMRFGRSPVRVCVHFGTGQGLGFRRDLSRSVVGVICVSKGGLGWMVWSISSRSLARLSICGCRRRFTSLRSKIFR